MISDWALVYVAVAMALGWAASTRGRSGPGFFALALITTPVIALIILVVSRGPHEVGEG